MTIQSGDSEYNGTADGGGASRVVDDLLRTENERIFEFGKYLFTFTFDLHLNGKQSTYDGQIGKVQNI